jgi:hypothetical protein
VQREFELTPVERTTLRECARHHPSRAVRIRAAALLHLAENGRASDAAQRLGVRSANVYNWKRRWLAAGLVGVLARRGRTAGPTRPLRSLYVGEGVGEGAEPADACPCRRELTVRAGGKDVPGLPLRHMLRTFEEAARARALAARLGCPVFLLHHCTLHPIGTRARAGRARRSQFLACLGEAGQLCWETYPGPPDPARVAAFLMAFAARLSGRALVWADLPRDCLLFPPDTVAALRARGILLRLSRAGGPHCVDCKARR